MKVQLGHEVCAASPTAVPTEPGPPAPAGLLTLQAHSMSSTQLHATHPLHCNHRGSISSTDVDTTYFGVTEPPSRLQNRFASENNGTTKLCIPGQCCNTKAHRHRLFKRGQWDFQKQLDTKLLLWPVAIRKPVCTISCLKISGKNSKF